MWTSPSADSHGYDAYTGEKSTEVPDDPVCRGIGHPGKGSLDDNNRKGREPLATSQSALRTTAASLGRLELFV